MSSKCLIPSNKLCNHKEKAETITGIGRSLNKVRNPWFLEFNRNVKESCFNEVIFLLGNDLIKL